MSVRHRWTKRLPKSVKMLKVIFCASVLLAVGDAQTTTTPPPTPEDYPEIVIIQVDGAPKCLGAFVAPEKSDNQRRLCFTEEPKSRFIATAAHCIYDVQASRLEFTSVQGKSEIKKVKRVLIHPYYLPPSFDYDIALLKTNELQAGFLLNKDNDPVRDLKVWEKDKATNARLEDRKSCRAMDRPIVVSSKMLCARADINSAMNGNPLFSVTTSSSNATKVLVGVGSYPPTGGSDGAPMIFTNIANSEIYSFIENYID